MKDALWGQVSWWFRKAANTQHDVVGKMHVWSLFFTVTCCMIWGQFFCSVFVGVCLFYSVVLASAGQRVESAVCVRISHVDFIPIWVTTQHWVEFPVIFGRLSWVICFILSINRVYMSIPVSQFILSLPFPLGIHAFVLCICFYFCLVNKIICTNSFRFHIYALIYGFCFSLSDSVWQSLGPAVSLF